MKDPVFCTVSKPSKLPTTRLHDHLQCRYNGSTVPTWTSADFPDGLPVDRSRLATTCASAPPEQPAESKKSSSGAVRVPRRALVNQLLWCLRMQSTPVAVT